MDQRANSAKLTKAAFTVVLSLAVVGGALWLTDPRTIIFCTFLQQDSIDAVFCGTHEKLGNYNEQPEEAVGWLLTYHGEAPSSVVMIKLAGWALDNQDNFIDILSRLDDKDVEIFVMRFTHAVVDSGQTDKFKGVFSARKQENRRLAIVLEQIVAQRR